MVKPRVCHLPYRHKASDAGAETIALARESGLELDDHQAFVVGESMSRKKDGSWVYFEVGWCEPRQNGKDAGLEARELGGLFLLDEMLIHSAHLFDTSLEHFRRLWSLIEDTPDLFAKVKRMTRSHGEEGIELKGGARIRFRTRSKGGGRGFSCDCLLLNEAMVIPEYTHGALLPTLSARPNPQVWYTGSAVDQLVHEHGVVFARVRERAIKGDDDGLAYFEWSAGNGEPEKDNPEHVGLDTFTDRAAWAQANPALGIRIAAEHVEFERRSMDMRTFAVERLGVGDWPRTDHVSSSPISLPAWIELEDERSRAGDELAFAFDVSPDRRGSISAAGRRSDGLWHVEVIEDRAGTAWLPSRLAELVRTHRPVGVVCDSFGGAASLIPAIEAENVQVETLTAQEHVQACGRFVDLIDEENLRHIGQAELTGAVRAAATRPLGDAWAWSRKTSTANISPLVSVTLALSAAMTTPATAPMIVLPA